jgi:hypothetical protein
MRQTILAFVPGPKPVPYKPKTAENPFYLQLVTFNLQP